MISAMKSATDATVAHIAPFITFVAIMAAEHAFNLPFEWAYPARFLLTALVLLIYSRKWIPLRPSFPLMSILVGAGVFLIWIAPDLLFGYRNHWLFNNSLLGNATTTVPERLRGNVGLLALRAASATLLVPIIEELFWRSWLMRYLIRPKFTSVPLGTYSASAFWITAVLFASEHGAFWEVGLAAGIIYNLWVIRTRNLADCILAHAVTNGILSAYVIWGGHWQYWL